MKGLVTFFKITRALQRAEEIKGKLDYCRKMTERGVCSCRSGELCQTALARYTKLSSEAIRQMLNRIRDFSELHGEDWNPFEVRRINAGQNEPRKFIRLK